MGPILETVDIYKYPTEIAQPSDMPVQLAFGDLHSNALKLIYFLIREGILSLAQSDFATVVEIYKTPIEDLSTDKLTTFNKIIANAKVISGNHHIIFIGDDLADRGMNDYFILKIFEKLNLNNVSFEVLISNHTSQFLYQFGYGLQNENQTLYINEYASFGTSLSNLQALIATQKVDINEISRIISSHYLPKLNLWNLDITSDSEENVCLNIYTHAPININTIIKVAMHFNIPIPSPQLKDLYEGMKNINTAFRNKIMDENAVNFLGNLREDEIIESLVNGRYQDLQPTNFPLPYPVLNIHGHVGIDYFERTEKSKWYYFNLDGDLGKKNEFNDGEYIVYTNNPNYSLTPTVTQSELSDNDDTVPMPNASKPLNTQETILSSDFSQNEEEPHHSEKTQFFSRKRKREESGQTSITSIPDNKIPRK